MVVAGLAAAPAAAQAPRAPGGNARSALVIGIGAYPDAPLPGAVSDARAVAAALRQTGFEVRTGFDLNDRDLRAAIGSFKQQLRPGGLGLIYFAGRAVQIARRNYLLPVDAKTQALRDLLTSGVDVQALLAERLAPSVEGILILDAARENAFEQRLRGFSAGLAMPEAAEGWFVALAAEPGRVAQGPAGSPSLYTRELIAGLGTPGIAIQTLFDQVRAGVSSGTQGQQVPWTLSTLQRPLALVPAPAGAPPPGPVDASPRPGTAEPGRAAAGAPLRDCPECPELAVVPAGSFEMGSNEFYERPRHRVTIAKPFAIGRREVTFEEWDRCVDEQGCKYRPPDRGWGRGSRPVTNISWVDATEFVEWLSAKTGKRYRLPSEAEWEYAARGGTQTSFWWGQDARAGQANCVGCLATPPQQTSPSASYAANPFGLYDTSGNAAEWVADCWHENYRGAPSDGSAWVARDCRERVLRGGSFASEGTYVRSSARFKYDADVRYYANGFRVARDLP
jgi:formylglycine-generating enzyme required for sulfatase activity